MSFDLHLGLIGCGRHGSRYAAHLLAGDVPGARLKAICRRDSVEGRRFAGEHGIDYHASYHELLADGRIEAVIVCLPPDLHPEVVLAAFAAGKKVLVEKPLAADLVGALAIERAAARRLLMVAQTLRFNSVVRAMESQRSELGEIHGFSASQRYEPLPLAWIEEPGRGGTLRVTGVHSFDLARYLTGAEAVRATCEAIWSNPSTDTDTSPETTEPVDRSFAAIVRMEPGPVLATIDNSRRSGGRAGRMELVGEHGSFIGDHFLGEAMRLQNGRVTPLRIAPPVPTVRECLRAFIAAARDEMPVPITATDGRKAVELVEACRKSARTGKPVRIAASHRG